MHKRHFTVDVLRGWAVVMMVIYHFCYDLTWFGWTQFAFHQHPFWLGWRAVIVALFVMVMGMSAALSPQQHRWHALIRRVLILGSAAMGISLVSYGLFGSRFIFFGVLHFITVASVLVILFRWAYWFNLFFGVFLVVLGYGWSHAFFDQPYWQWIGLMTYKPATEDYVPLLPWLGWVLIGMFAGRYLQDHSCCCAVSHNLITEGLRQCGHKSLLIYLLHQPILFALLGSVKWLLQVF